MPRPAYVVVGWMAATAAAVGIAYAGVSSVAGGVVDPLPPAAGLPVTAAPAAPASPTDERPSDTATTSSPTSPSPTPDPSASSRPPVVSAPAAEVRSYALVGGSATLRYEPGRVTVVTAEPRQGFTVEVEGDGTAEVRVEFDSDEHRSRLRGTWEDGPRERVDEDADRDDDDGDED